MLKNPFDRFKLRVGGSGDAGFSSGSETGDSSYSSDPGSGSESTVPGASNNSQAYTGVTAIIGMDTKPFCMTILLRNGTVIEIDKHNNVKTFTPMLSEVF